MPFHDSSLTLIKSFDTEFPSKIADLKIMTYIDVIIIMIIANFTPPFIQFEMAANVYPSHRLSQKVAKSPKLRRLSRDLLLEILDAIADFLKETDLSVNS